MRQLYILILCSSFIWANSISLEEILNHASASALSLKIKQKDVLIESKNVEGIESGYYPTLNFVYNNEYTESLDGIPLGSESVGGIIISNGTRYQNSAALQLNYNLYHFGTTQTQVKIATIKVGVKDIEWCKEEKTLHIRLVELYTDALKQQNEKKYRQEMLLIRKRLYAMKERLYKAGEYSKVDLGDEAIYLITIQRDIENAHMQYRDDIIKLSQLSYMEIEKEVNLLAIKTIIESEMIGSFEDTVEAKILQEKILQKEAEVSLQFRGQMPSIGLYSNYFLYSSDPTEYDYPIKNLKQKSWNVGFSIRFNIFEGFKNSASVQGLELEMSQLKLQYEQSEHDFKYEVLSKNTKLDELAILRAQEKNLLDKNEKKLRMIRRLRKHYKVDMLTELNSQYELQERTLNLINREIEALKEEKLLQIANRGVQTCTQH